MGLQIGQVLEPSYGVWMVILSFLIAVCGSLMALLCARRMFRRNGELDKAMSISAAVSLGGIGIWSMHFIGMVAYQLPVSIAYDVGLTLLSLVAAIVISGIALYLAGRGKQRSRRGGWMAGSILAAIGVCAMHYLGMYAMNMRAAMEFDVMLVATSAAIAFLAAAAALWLAFHVTRFPQMIVAALLMGIAVCSMHYVGMASATMICTAAAPDVAWALSGPMMGLFAFGVASLVLILIGWLVSERFITDLENPAHHRRGEETPPPPPRSSLHRLAQRRSSRRRRLRQVSSTTNMKTGRPNLKLAKFESAVHESRDKLARRGRLTEAASGGVSAAATQNRLCERDTGALGVCVIRTQFKRDHLPCVAQLRVALPHSPRGRCSGFDDLLSMVPALDEVALQLSSFLPIGKRALPKALAGLANAG